MKVFTNKKIIQKMTIVLVFLMLFNFIVPSYSKAGVVDAIAEGAESIGEALAPIINVFARFLGDSILTVVQKMFIGTDPFVDDEINIAISPGKIFSGLVYTLNIDFISTPQIDNANNDENNDDTDNADTTTTENIENEDWYKSWNNAIKKAQEINIANDGNTDRVAAAVALRTILVDTDAKTFMDECYNKMTVFDEDTFVEIIDEKVKSTEQYKGAENQEEFIKYLNDYLDNGLFDLDDIGLTKAAKEYYDYMADNDPALYFASKPENAPAYVLHNTIATWYKIMRNIALVFLLSILVYVGIRIMLSSTAADNTKYKKMLIDWVVAICILFALHYIMAFTVNITQLVVDAFTGKEVTVTSNDVIMHAVREKASHNNTSGLGYTILYLVLIFYTIYFLFYYVKRVVYAAFLTLIAPLVALTYPMDKMGDSKAQAFEMWLREYIMNVVVQPIHLLVYTTMVTSALTLAENNPIYAIVVIGAMIPAEKFIKEMFGLDTRKGPKGGFLAGAATMTAAQKLAGKKPPQFGHHPGESGKDSSSKKEETKKPRYDGERQAELSRSVTSSGRSASTEGGNSTPRTTNTENPPGVDNGDFQDSRENRDSNSFDNQVDVDNFALGTENGQGEIGGWTSQTQADIEDLYPENDSDARQENKEDVPQPEEKNDQIHQYGVGMQEGEKSSLKTPEERRDEQTEEWKNATSGYKDLMKQSTNEKAPKQNEQPNKTNEQIKAKGPNKDAQTSNTKNQKKKSIRGAAVAATAGHYMRKVVNGKNLRKLGRGIVRTGLGIATAGTAATIGLAAGIATGDPSKAWQYAAAGAMAGNKIGRNVGDGVANLAGGVVDLGKDISSTYKEQKNEIIKYDKEAQKAEMEKENKKYVYKSPEVKAAIKRRYGKLDKEQMKEKQAVIERYRNNGVQDLDTIFNSYNLEQGKDAYGNDIGTKLSQEHAMYIAQMASRMDPDSASSRKSVENSMQMQFAQNYENDGMDRTKSIEQAKTDRKREMQYIDMAQGKTRVEAGITAKQAEINKTYEDSKEEKAARMQAQFNAEEQNKNAIIKNMQAKTKNGEVTIKDTAIVTGQTGKVTVHGKEVKIENPNSKTKRVKPTNQDNSTK